MKKRHKTYKKKEQNTKDKSNQYTLDVNKINTTVKKNNLAECMKRNDQSYVL